MKLQWTFILALIFALVVALFAVFNVESVPVNYIFGEANLPLIIVILGAALIGGLFVGSVGIIWQIRLKRKIRQLEKDLHDAERVAEKPEPSAEIVIPPPPGTMSDSYSQQ
ncbi:MAG TPA: lipopolysaccharide assembly protein LapA domain-containing protein [Bacilli bacterium]